MSFNNCWMISSSYDFQGHQQRSHRCCPFQTALLWFKVCSDSSPALPELSLALPDAVRLAIGAPRLVAGTPSYSEGRQEWPPRDWYSPEIDTSKFTLHILWDTPGGFQWLKYILLMWLELSWKSISLLSGGWTVWNSVQKDHCTGKQRLQFFWWQLRSGYLSIISIMRNEFIGSG